MAPEQAEAYAAYLVQLRLSVFEARVACVPEVVMSVEVKVECGLGSFGVGDGSSDI
jgi:hypothetical protein